MMEVFAKISIKDAWQDFKPLHTLLLCLLCWFWTSKCQLGSVFIVHSVLLCLSYIDRKKMSSVLGCKQKLFTCSKSTIETIEKHEICSKLTIKTQERSYWLLSELYYQLLTYFQFLQCFYCWLETVSAGWVCRNNVFKWLHQVNLSINILNKQ